MDTVLNALNSIDNNTYLLYLVSGAVTLWILVVLVRRLFKKHDLEDIPIEASIKALNEPGGMVYERRAALQRIMDRHGLTYRYRAYDPKDGRSLWSPREQIKKLGGPFQLIGESLTDVYDGSPDGHQVTIGEYSVGSEDRPERALAAIVKLRGITVPTFTAAPRNDFPRGSGDALPTPTHPQLEKTHRIRGDAAARAALSGALLDLLAREPGWAIEGKDGLLVIARRLAPSGEFGLLLSVQQIQDFVDGAFRIVDLFSRFASP